jgi:hypothetical protein
MKSSIDRLENLVRVSLEGNHDSSTTVRVVFANRRIDGRSLHGTQCGTAALVERAALCPKADVPSLLVEVEVLCIKLVKEVRVADVQLVGCDTDNWA